MQEYKKFAPAGAFWIIALAAQMSGYTDPRIATWLFIAGTLLLAWPASDLLQRLAEHCGIRFRTPWVKTEAKWMLPFEAIERFAPPNLLQAWRTDPAANLHAQLLSGKLIGRGTPHYREAGKPPVIIGRGEWQTLKIAGQNCEHAVSSTGPAHSYDNLEIAKLAGS